MLLDKTVKSISRLTQMINILGKYSFEDIVVNTALNKIVSSKRKVSWQRRDKSVFEYNRWERIRMVVEELGPTFIKLAQFLSNRPDVLPEPLIREFTKLQSEVLPFNTHKAKSIIEGELGKPIEEIFSYFDNRVIGSASIGQVHRARLLNGENVVVKVQRPEASKQVLTDLVLLHEFVRLTDSYFKNLGIFNAIEIVETFDDSMRKELDYNTEARSIQQFRNIYYKKKKLHIPKAYRNLTTSKVLITEFVSGCHITDIDQLISWGLDPKEIAENGMAIYLSQIFEYGFFHADPHPGNVLVRPNGDIVLIDFGMIGKLSRNDKYNFSGILASISQRNAKGMATHIQRLSTGQEIEHLKPFINELEDLIDDFEILNVDEQGMSDLTARFQKIIYDYKLQIPGSIFLILRSLAMLEGIGRKLHPNFNTLEFIRPYGTRLFYEQYSSENLKSEFQYAFSQVSSMLYSMPVDIKYILKKIRKGQLHSSIEIKGYERFLRKLDSIANRFVLTLLIVSLLVTSALMMNSSSEVPHLSGIPYTSLVGFLLSGTLSVYLFIYTIRHRNGR